MELGYLTPEGCLVVADSLGRRTLFKAYRVDEPGRVWEVMGYRRPLEPLGSMTVEVTLHRNGWSWEGEVLLRSSPGRLYRSRTRHLVLGSDWRSLRRKAWAHFPSLERPWLGASAVRRPAPRIRRGTPFFLSFSEGDVKGCRRDGATVQILAVERKEFLDFVTGKLKATLRFESESAAEAFARGFPTASDAAALDVAVHTDIERSLAYRKPKLPPLAQRPATLTPAGARVLLVFAVLVLAVALVIAAAKLPPGLVLLEWIPIIAGAVLVWREERKQYTVEQAELKARFPKQIWERFGEDVPRHAAGFVFMLRDQGTPLNPDTADLAPVDAILRSQKPEARFAAPLLGAGALTAEVFLANLGRNIPTRWEYQAGQGGMVLLVHDVYWVSPVTWAAEVWTKKPKETLQEKVEDSVTRTATALAFGHSMAFASLGFAADPDHMGPLVDRVMKAAEGVPPESFVLGERHMRRRRVPFGSFSVDVVEGEVISRRGPSFRPLAAFPFFEPPFEVHGTLDTASPVVPNSEDIAVVRLSGQPMVPLGIQIRNFVEVGPDLASRGPELTLRMIAVSDKLEVLTPRIRATNPDTKDALVPLKPREDGMPQNPYAQILGRIEGVAEATNPLTGTGVWRLRVDVSGLLLDVFVRKDRCQAVPAIGSHVTGNLWLAADLVAKADEGPGYIR